MVRVSVSIFDLVVVGLSLYRRDSRKLLTASVFWNANVGTASICRVKARSRYSPPASESGRSNPPVPRPLAVKITSSSRACPPASYNCT